jgi:hypothetical protein
LQNLSNLCQLFSISLIMAPLCGHKLSVAQIALVVAPSFILFGYNQAGVGGLLSVSVRRGVTKSRTEIDCHSTAPRLDQDIS